MNLILSHGKKKIIFQELFEIYNKLNLIYMINKNLVFLFSKQKFLGLRE